MTTDRYFRSSFAIPVEFKDRLNGIPERADIPSIGWLMTAIAREPEMAVQLLQPLIEKTKEDEIRFTRELEELRSRFLAGGGGERPQLM